MEVEFDTVKDAANIVKHGVSLRLGAVILEHRLGVVQDFRRDYGELRFNAFGWVNNRLFACTYTLRGEVYRIISVRRSSRREQRIWLS